METPTFRHPEPGMAGPVDAFSTTLRQPGDAPEHCSADGSWRKGPFAFSPQRLDVTTYFGILPNRVVELQPVEPKKQIPLQTFKKKSLSATGPPDLVVVILAWPCP
jgi:hypothetical protein